MDPILLARIQFALTVIFHFVFPSISIGLGLVVAVLEVQRWRFGRQATAVVIGSGGRSGLGGANDEERARHARAVELTDTYTRAAAFWTKLFALTFVVGVATGIVMEFQFGTNWSRYSTFVGDIFGAPLAAEALLAFFLESTFLGLLLFGGSRIGSGLRALSACLVAGGAALSGLWIIIANSWMQTPAGYEIQGTGANAKAVLIDAWAALFNPSTLPRYIHTITSSWAMAGFLVIAVGAWLWRSGRAGDVARLSLRVGLVVAIVGTVGVLGSGDTSSRQVASTQPAKFAAMQGLYETTEGAGLLIWSLPPTQDPNLAPEGPEILVTRLLSFLTWGDFRAAVTGLKDFPQTDWPPVAATFLAYHHMVILGSLMALLLLTGAWYAWRGRLERSPRWLRFATWSFILPFLAINLGWATAEIGRQPWIVYGVMRTADATSPIVSAGEILFSIILFSGVYLLLGALWLFLMIRAIRIGPVQEPVPEQYGIDVSVRLPGLRVEAH